MSITKVKNYGVAPYYDDYDETKNYHRILFRPGYSVQARELTQLQTALQSQIDRLGQYSFGDGSRVIGGKPTVNVEYHYVKIETGAENYLDQFVGTTITGSSTGVEAEVQSVIQADNTDPATLYVKYQNSGTDQQTRTFSAGETLSASITTGTITAEVAGGTGSTINDPIGKGSAVNIEEGVYFIAGTFVHVPTDTLILDKYSNTPSYTIGLKVTEEIIDSATDITLTDNALGTPNEAAPGATRYTISTELVKDSLDLDARSVNSYIMLMNIQDGKEIKNDVDKLDTGLTERLAKRTSEESGDYYVRPFLLDIKEHLNNEEGNNGYLLAADGGDEDLVAVGVEPSVAYIQGYRVEKISTEYVELAKPREDTDKMTLNDEITSIGFGNYIELNVASTSGIPDLNGYSTIDLKDSSTVIGYCRARGLEYDGAADVHRLYIFDITMNTGQSFSSVDNVASTGFAANLATEGSRFETGSNNLVYKLPADAIETLKIGNNHTANYIVRTRLTAIGPITSGEATFELNTGTVLSNDDDVIIAVGSDVFEVPDSQISGVGSSTMTVSGLGSYSGTPVVLCSAEKTNATARSKEFHGAVTKQFTFAAGTSIYQLDDVDITFVDLIELDSTGEDLYDKFIIDNGQRDNYYDNGKLILRGGQTIPDGATFTVTYDCYRHLGAGDYFSADSYPTDQYDQIPTYNGLQLRDCLDFRPTKARISGTAGSEFTTGINSQAPNPIQPVGLVKTAITFYLPRIDKLFLTREGEYKIVEGTSALTPEEPNSIEDALHLYTFEINPYVFQLSDIKTRMVDHKRYTMRDIGKLDRRIKKLEYYTSLSLLEKSASEAQIAETDGTPRFKNGFVVDGFYGHNVGDVGHPDYNASIDKANGLLRPKFDSRNVNLVRKTSDVGTAVKSALGGIVTMPYNVVTEINQPYSTYAEFVNPYNVFVWDGTLRLSPESDEWKDVDQRPDIIINDNSLYDQFATLAEEEGILGTVWNEWETNWSGTRTNTSSTEEVTSTRIVQTGSTTTTVLPRTPTQTAVRQAPRAPRWQNVGNRFTGATGGRQRLRTVTPRTTTPGFALENTPIEDRFQGTITTNTSRIDETVRTTTAWTEQGTQSRAGIETTLASDTERKELGNRVVEVNFVPFMRSREIFFKAELLKPNTKMYAFFNGTGITQYCKQQDFVEYSDQTDVRTYEGWIRHYSPTSGTLVTDDSGRLEGSFIIPRNSLLKFKTGTKEFKLTDSITNNDDEAETTATESFFAQGLLEVTQKTIISTKVPRLSRREVSQNRSTSRSGTDITFSSISRQGPTTQTRTPTRWVDPLAETFVCKTPGGIFTTGIELFFAIKDSRIPVTISIREAENGTPTQRIVPGTEVTVYPSDITTSTNASVATDIDFDFPVYLQDGTEYSIVIISNSDKYKVYVAEMGGFDLTDPTFRVTKQPYNGVFFTSQNASTWTPHQSKDLKFKIKRASFIGTSAEVNLVNDRLPTKMLGNNPFNFVSNEAGSTCKIRVNHKNHGMYGPDGTHQVTFSEVPNDVNGIPVATLNGTHTVYEADLDSYAIIVSGQATALNRRGGGRYVSATYNQVYDLLRASIQSLEFNGVGIRYFMTGMTGSCADPAPQISNYINQPEFEIPANGNVEFGIPFMISGPANNNDEKSFNLRCVLTNGGKENLSPVIDLNRCSLTTVQNRLNDTQSNQAEYEARGTFIPDTDPIGTTSAAKYMTKRVELNENADKIDVFLNANRPSDSDIDVYYKVTNDTDTDFDELPWIEASPTNFIPIDNSGQYTETNYSIEPGFFFSSFAVKVVLRSRNSSSVPTVKDFRAIATT